MLFFFFGELLEDAPASRVLGDLRGACVELQAAALGRNRDPERVAREEELGGASFSYRWASGPARLAGTVDLEDALRGGETARRRHFLEQRLDVRAQELERSVAAFADEMKVPGVTVGMLETESPFAEIDLARDPGVYHPLQGAVDGRAADALILLADQRRRDPPP